MELFKKKFGPVFLKEDSESTFFIERMNVLLDKATGELKREIEKNIKLASYGEIGENTIAFELKNSGIDMFILHDIYLEVGEMSAQIDYMLFTRRRVYIIECKNLIGNITVDNDGNFVRKYELFGKQVKEGIYSPITQNERHMEVIKQLRAATKSNPISRAMFESNFEHIYIPIVVLANPRTVLNDRYAKKEVKRKIYRADQLVRVIKELESEEKSDLYSEKDIREHAEFFLNASLPNKSDYSKKYEEMLDKCEKEKVTTDEHTTPQKKMCPRCGAELVIRTAKKGVNAGGQFWGCSSFPNCRYIENI